jgi:hypothetical protein
MSECGRLWSGEWEGKTYDPWMRGFTKENDTLGFVEPIFQFVVFHPARSMKFGRALQYTVETEKNLFQLMSVIDTRAESYTGERRSRLNESDGTMSTHGSVISSDTPHSSSGHHRLIL